MTVASGYPFRGWPWSAPRTAKATSMGLWKTTMRLATLAIALWLTPAVGITACEAEPPPSVWFMPAGNSPDVNALFKYPDQWSRVRAQVNAFAFSPGQLQPAKPNRAALLPDLKAVDAFRQVTNWGLQTVIGVPALKEWDCVARQTPAVTLESMRTVYAAGGKVHFLDMDEPLISALGLNTPVCHLGTDAAAAEVAAYIHTVTADPDVVRSGVIPQFIDTEAYPSLTVPQIETWLQSLTRLGVKPAAFHLDVNVNYIDINPPLKARLAADLQELQRYLAQAAIPFGVIIWSGYDPVRNDQEYYDHAMTWTRALHAAIGRPDRVIFASWVRRCSLTLPCQGRDLGCSPSDSDGCGSVSVPLNLPEDSPGVFSHTKLMHDALALLAGP